VQRGDDVSLPISLPINDEGAHGTAGDDAPHRPPAVAWAREQFLNDRPLRAGLVRQPILASWTRSRQLQVRTDQLELGDERDAGRDSPLLQVASPVVETFAERWVNEPMSLILCDGDGVVLARRTGDSALEQHLNRVWLAPGFSYAESSVGTNGIGTTLESRGPAHVFGHEHYVEHLEELACAGAPIRHPVTGRVVGVLDLTCWRRDAGGLMIGEAAAIAARIEQQLLEASAQRELQLLHEYLVACRHHHSAVLAVGKDLLMMNDRARELLDPGDQTRVVSAGTEALAAGRRSQLVVELPSGATARLSCRPSWPEGAGGVLLIDILAAPAPASRRPHQPVPALPTVVGTGGLWSRCVQAVDRHFLAREWVVLAGEPGSGRRTLARATHQLHTPAAHLRMLDARDWGPAWLEEAVAELGAGHGTLVLAHLDRLPGEGAAALADALEPHRESTDPDRPWVVATLSRDLRGQAFTRLIECFPRTVQVPPLRHHLEDVPHLVAHLISRTTHGADLTCSAEAMRVLMRNRWPGNIGQLQQVLRKAVGRRRTGVIDVRDLPPEVFATVRRVLTPLEAIECDAIVEALVESGGNKGAAAQRLGMSRATIYRKVRDYGIALPPDGPVVPRRVGEPASSQLAHG
jgi:sigma-54 dependent transcriptional regulator, acetoin dehydrogenase operon transcriptional activator AcoR